MRRTPDLFVEQAALGEREALPEDADRIAAIRTYDEAVRAEDPPHLAAVRIRALAGARRPRPRGRVLAPLAFAAAAAAAFVLVPRPAVEEITAKGDAPPLVVHRLLGPAAERLEDGAAVRAGDRLQISAAPRAKAAVVVSLDGRGVVTLHHPAREDLSPALERPGALPTSYELDDAPGFERFVLVAGDDVDVRAVLAAARSAARAPDAERAPLVLPPRWLQTSLVIAKESP